MDQPQPQGQGPNPFESSLKKMLGEQAWAIAFLQTQNEQLAKELERLKEGVKPKGNGAAQGEFMEMREGVGQ